MITRYMIVAAALLFPSCGQQAEFSDGASTKRVNVGPGSRTGSPDDPNSGDITVGGGGTSGTASTNAGPAGRTPGSTTDVEVIQPSTDIEFGADVVYHIGDNSYASDSACASQIQTYSITGDKFYFEFEVLEDNTAISVSVNSLCGVDYTDSGRASLMLFGSPNSYPIQPINITPTDTLISLPSATLNRGKYAVLLESRQSLLNGLDRDDFIVGKIKVKANKNVLPGAIKTSL